MKKLILILMLAGVAFAQSDTPNYDHYQFSISAGSALWTKPFAPKFEGNVTFGYKFAENYAKFFDTAYGTFGYIGENRNEANDYRVGVQRTMMGQEDRAGLLWRVALAGGRRGDCAFWTARFMASINCLWHRFRVRYKWLAVSEIFESWRRHDHADVEQGWEPISVRDVDDGFHENVLAHLTVLRCCAILEFQDMVCGREAKPE
jgi:hypothetical protein